MADVNLSSDGNNRKLRNSIERLENNARHLKQEINDKVDLLIASINSQRKKLLDQVDSELNEAREPLKNFENKNTARMELKERLAKELEGDLALLSRLTSEIDEELNKMGMDLPNFRIQWNPNVLRLCEDDENVGELKSYKHSQFEASNTPLWSTLDRGKADNEVREPKAIAIDTETSNIYVGDASAGKILIMDKTGKYLNTLTFKRPYTIRSMVVSQNFIYCRSNSFFYTTTLYQLDKNTGELLNKYENNRYIETFIALADEVFVSDLFLIVFLSLALSELRSLKIESPHFKNGTSCVKNVCNVNEELVMLVSDPKEFPIQIFDKNITFLRAIAEDISPFAYSAEVYICIDKHWNIIISIDGKKLVNVYNKDGKLLTCLGQKKDEESGLYYPRGIALDTDGNLVVCNNRKKNILQAY